MGFSLFSPDYSKPGPGVIIDDNAYPPFIRFWKRYGRNFSKLLQLNVVYALISLPVYVWLTSLINVASTQAGGGVMTILGSVLLSVVIDLPGLPLAALVIASILLLGPATAALSCCALDCAWDRPGLLWPTFREAWKANWKQALPFGIADVLVCFVSHYYLVDGAAVLGSYAALVQLVWFLFALLYAMIRVYIYPVMVTIELPLGGLVKNCLILALLKPWRPLLVILIALVLSALCLVIDIVLIPCFLYSFIAFAAAFLAQPMIGKYLMNTEKNSEESTDSFQNHI